MSVSMKPKIVILQIFTFILFSCMARETASTPLLITKATVPTKTAVLTIAPSATFTTEEDSVNTTAVVLHEGVVILEAHYEDGYISDLGYSSDEIALASFDLDLNQKTANQLDQYDIGFALSKPQPQPFLVLHPVFGSMGRLLRMGLPEYQPGFAEFKFEECLEIKHNFGHGGIPIPALGSYYCWLTNEGHMAEFVVDKIEQSNETYQIEIDYIVWGMLE